MEGEPNTDRVAYIDEYPHLEEIVRLRRRAGQLALFSVEEMHGQILLFELPETHTNPSPA